MALFLVGHVTKEGALAGPRVLEHLVDTVLYFESEPSLSLRLLRAVKNRFGATDEVGVFEMGERGLAAVANPSALFLAQRPVGAPGSVVCPAMNGSRPLLVEVQALVSPSGLAMPRARPWGSTPGGCTCWRRCWASMAACRLPPTTFSSTLPAASAWPSRPPTWRWRRRRPAR